MITLLSGTRRAQDRGNALEFFGTGQKNIIHCWPLTDSGIDIVGGNHLTSTSYPIFSRDGAKFNGSNSFVVTGSAINLTSTKNISVLFTLEFVSYNLTAQANIINLSVSPGSNAGSFAVNTKGADANDPLELFVNGNVGSNDSWYNYTAYRFTDKPHIYLATFDFSKAVNEQELYMDGAYVTRSAKTNSNNNTGNFGNYVLYMGSRGGVANFASVRLKNVALFNTVDQDVIRVLPEYVAWSNDSPVTQYWTFPYFTRGHVVRHRGRIKKIWKDDILLTQQEALEEKATEIALDEIREEKAKLETARTEKEFAFTEAEIAEIRLQKDFLEKQKQILIAMLIMLKDEMEDEDDINTLLMLL